MQMCPQGLVLTTLVWDKGISGVRKEGNSSMERAIQRLSFKENKTWAQFPLHVASTPPGSGVCVCVLWECLQELGSVCCQFT